MAHLEKMAERQRGVHPHFFGVTKLNLAILASLKDDQRSAIDLANEAIEALEETSSRIELSAALMAKGYAQTLLGLSDDANLAISRGIAVEEEEAILERCRPRRQLPWTRRRMGAARLSGG